MLTSRGGSSSHRDAAAPKKRVTFYGPVTSTRGDRLGYNGTESRGTRQKTSATSGFHQSLTSQETQQKPVLTERNKVGRAHSKTTVQGVPLKTRLNCDHLRPKCQCSTLANKKKVGRTKYRGGLVCGPRRTLVSTCSLPRGEVDGRKTYQEKGTTVSVLNDNWQPESQLLSGEKSERIDSHKAPLDVNKENNSTNISNNTDVIKKKVKFADIHKDLPSSSSSNPRGHAESRGSREGSQDHTYLSSFQTGSENKSQSHRTVTKQDSFNSRSRSSQNIDNTSSRTKNQDLGSQAEYCKLCELAKSDYPEDRIYDRKNYPTYDYKDGPSALYTDIPEATGLSNEPCLLCRRYGNNHYYIDDHDKCELCDRVYRSHQRSNYKDDTRSASVITSSPFLRQNSAPGLYSGGVESLEPRTIPYEPRTDLVKDLKKKLEADYRDDHKVKRKGSGISRRSWDAEDVSKLSGSQSRRHLAWDPTLCHKCVHRYKQNDRLFLEPTVTDDVGRSVCGECGAPEPSDPEQDPFLYHITLGDMQDNEDSHATGGHKSTALKNQPIKSKNVHFTAPIPSRKSSGDTSKHIYAKLNRNVNNILPGKSGFSLRPRSASWSRLAAAHTKRPPGKSMALIDHLI
ncbi:hypothetical protein Pmani_030652 [Petrolisthes manimaculis]|uniref:Uncharacterized protein n=1 Tax=Petrolisthes manimaculis TaxID=1843537 RepID=A0AAE1NV72_9EUCA|nr:hypothetical protein Pmani_030652 [Petrolisthes manimaculis]